MVNILNNEVLFEAVMVKKVFMALTSKINHDINDLYVFSNIIEELYLAEYDFCTMCKLVFIKELIMLKLNKIIIKNHLGSESLLKATYTFNNLNVDFEGIYLENNHYTYNI